MTPGERAEQALRHLRQFFDPRSQAVMDYIDPAIDGLTAITDMTNVERLRKIELAARKAMKWWRWEDENEREAFAELRAALDGDVSLDTHSKEKP